MKNSGHSLFSNTNYFTFWLDYSKNIALRTMKFNGLIFGGSKRCHIMHFHSIVYHLSDRTPHNSVMMLSIIEPHLNLLEYYLFIYIK